MVLKTFQLVASPLFFASRADSMASMKLPGFLTHQKDSLLSSLPTTRTTFNQPQARRTYLISPNSIPSTSTILKAPGKPRWIGISGVAPSIYLPLVGLGVSGSGRMS